MVASLICSLCQPCTVPGLFISPIEPVHHYGKKAGHVVPGLLGGWECVCFCTKEWPVDLMDWPE